MQTAVVWTCLPFIRSGQNHLAKHSERGKKTRQPEEEVGRHHQGMDRPGIHQVPEGSGEQRKMEETGCEVICGAPTSLSVKGGEVRETSSNKKKSECRSRLMLTLVSSYDLISTKFMFRKHILLTLYWVRS